jgi:hypothetical protein
LEEIMNWNFDQLESAIEKWGCHEQLGPTGPGPAIEQNPFELAAFLSAVGPFETFLEIGSGYRAGLSFFLAVRLGIHVTSVDITDYHHDIPDVTFVVQPEGSPLWDYQKKYDVVFLDGPKSYDALKAAYLHYRDAAPIVAFHDIGGLRACEGVMRFWQEISRYRSGNMRRNFFSTFDTGPTAAGIGWEIRNG